MSQQATAFWGAASPSGRRDVALYHGVARILAGHGPTAAAFWMAATVPLIPILILLLAAALLPALPARAIEVEFDQRPVRRDVLALYDGRHERAPHETRIHKFAEMPLNHLGFNVVYHDVNRPLPAVETLGNYRAILTWLVEPLRNAQGVGGWLVRALEGNTLRYVVLGEALPSASAAARPLESRLMERLGLQSSDQHVDVTHRTRIVTLDGDMIGFERPLDKVLPEFPILKRLGNDAKVHLELAHGTGLLSATSAIVVTSRQGGYAPHNFTIYYEASTDRVAWTLNPFAFFRRALEPERFPIPDTTTLNGRRIYFSHIDGDGWNNVTEIDGAREAGLFSSEMIMREAIEPYPDLPVTVGLMAGDTLPVLGGRPEAADIARRLFSLPQVEVGSHTYSHPFNWSFFETYDREAEEQKLASYVRPERPLRDRLSNTMANLAGKSLPPDASDRYVAGSDDLPRTYMREPFSLDVEIAGALKASEKLAPSGKKALLYQWSGDTTPFAAAIRAVREAGAYNINGGDSRFDSEFPSVAYVPPIGRPVRGERQIYAANSNENTYTNDWTGPYFGFFLLEQTLTNTETPRRLKPFNLYYHMYSGEKPAALSSVRYFLDMARSAPVIPVPASHYAAIADSFYGVDVRQVGLFSWSVGRRGALQTIRFDDADDLSVDVGQSTGVLGYTRHAASLYVALDPAVETAIVTARPRAAEAVTAPGLRLVSSRWRLFGRSGEPCDFTLGAEGFGTGDMHWQGLPRRGFRIQARRDNVVLSEEIRWTDGDGRLEVSLALDGRRPLELRVSCHD